MPDFQGIIDKLDYLNDGTPNSLAVDAIWISPIYPSPMADFGYDVSDYTNIHRMFGDLATFDRLLSEAHQRGIKVILDYVPNHTSDEHPWFVESRSSRDNPKRDWYLWRDAKPDGSPPNNWASMFGGSGWTWDEITRQYYLHLFLSQQPDLNWRNPMVRAAMYEVLHFWLGRGVDGVRMDVAGFIMKDEFFRDNPVRTDAPTRAYDGWGRLEHRYDIDQPEVHDCLREVRQVADSYGECVTIGEVWAEPRAKWVSYYGANLDELHLPFNFQLLYQPWDAVAIRAAVDELEAVLPAGAWPNYVLGSHDAARLANRYGKQAVRVAAMLLLTLRGTPTLYYGDELGMENGIIPAERMQDPQGINLGVERTRDICRTPMQWDASPYAGFSTCETWLPVNADYLTRNVQHQSNDPSSVLSLYRRLLHLRKQTPALNCGVYRPLDGIPPQVFAYLREQHKERIVILLNFGDTPIGVNVAQVGSIGKIILSTGLDHVGPCDLSRAELQANEGLIVQVHSG